MTGIKTAAVALADADPILAGVIARVGPISAAKRRRGRPVGNPYGALLRAVVGQQLSVKAAATIFERVLGLFGGEMPSPQELLDADPQTLRDAGLSWRKVEYLSDLATHVLDGSLEVERFGDLDDEAIVAEITAIRGFGLWTAQMFLMFHLERADVLPVGDLGIRNAIRLEYQLEELPGAAEIEPIAEPWRPYRTLACLYLWESLSNNPG